MTGVQTCALPISRKHVVTEISFEDGRKGTITGDVRIDDMPVHGSELREAAE